MNPGAHGRHAAKGPPRVRIFLAEDDREMRQMIAVTLRRDGHFVLEAADGAALIRDFWDTRPDDTPNLIITDVRMPGVDGIAMLETLRHHPRCPAFIVVTAFGDPELHAEATRLGALRIFDKPFDLGALRDEVSIFASGGADASALRAGDPSSA